MVEYFSKRSHGEVFERQARALKHDVWVNAAKVTKPELNALIGEYELDRNITYDVCDRDELPRIEFNRDDAYVFIRVPRLSNTSHVTTMPMLCVIKPDVFMTIGSDETISPAVITEIAETTTTRHGFDLLVDVVVACVSMYEELLQHSARSINDTAARLHSHEATNRDFIHFITVEDNLMACRMNLEGMQAVVRRIKETTHQSMTNRDDEALDDVRLELEQLLVAVESYASRVESIRNAYTTVTNNVLNQRLKTLTVFTVLITLPNVIFGMYGMNIHLPYATEPWAYLGVVSVTMILIIIVYLIGRRTKIF